MSVTKIIAQLCRKVVAEERVFTSKADLACYSYDAYLESALPDCVVVPENTTQVSQLVAACIEHGVPYVARGAGTGYAGGSIPIHGGLIILLTDLLDLHINSELRWAWVGAGVTTNALACAAKAKGLRYPPDPSSYKVSTIGGNLATNAGGPHSLGYGVTTHYVMETEVVAPDGQVRRLGGLSPLCSTLDMRGLLVGSEGTLGIMTGARFRLIDAPESVRTILVFFERSEQAITALEESFTRGLVPEALDLTCGVIVPENVGHTFDGRTIAYVDVEGFRESVDARVAAIVDLFRRHGGSVETMSRGDLMTRRFHITIDRWRKVVTNTSALRYFLFDAIIPRSRLRDSIRRIADAAQRYGLCVANTFHAGDGNIHPTPFYDPTVTGSRETLLRFWKEVLTDVADLGGVLSGEHGIGLEKVEIMPNFFGNAELGLMREIKRGVDPLGLCNPGKVISTLMSCQRPERYNSWFSEKRVRMNLLDGYVEAVGDCTRAEISQALEGSPYELGFDPVGWDEDMPLSETIALGRPGWSERLRGPCRDQFLGGRFGGRGLVLGSPFSKDVSAYDLRKLAYGSGTIFGFLDRAWLRISPRPKIRYEGIAQTTLKDGRRALRELDQIRAPFRTLALVRLTDGIWSILCIVEGEESLTERTLMLINNISRTCGILFEWVPLLDNVPTKLTGRRYWTWYEHIPWDSISQDQALVHSVEQARVNESVTVLSLVGSNVIAVERRDFTRSDERKVCRPDEAAFATNLRTLLESEIASP